MEPHRQHAAHHYAALMTHELVSAAAGPAPATPRRAMPRVSLTARGATPGEELPESVSRLMATGTTPIVAAFQSSV